MHGENRAIKISSPSHLQRGFIVPLGIKSEGTLTEVGSDVVPVPAPAALGRSAARRSPPPLVIPGEPMPAAATTAPALPAPIPMPPSSLRGVSVDSSKLDSKGKRVRFSQKGDDGDSVAQVLDNASPRNSSSSTNPVASFVASAAVDLEDEQKQHVRQAFPPPLISPSPKSSGRISPKLDSLLNSRK